MVENLNKKTAETKEVQNSVTVESVASRVNYNKLIEEFGTEKVTPDLLEKFKKVTGKDLHPWLTRGIFFSHRELNTFLTAYENGDPVFLYTGRGPSSESMHIGHLIPFMFTKWLQEAFDCPLVIQLSDEEKYAFGKGSFNELRKMGYENAKDIIAVGFDPKKTFIFSNRDYRIACPEYEVFTTDLKKNASVKEVSKIFGFSDERNVLTFDWPFYQSAASFSQAFPHIFNGRPAYCLIPCAIDQDPYFRLGRGLASKMNLLKTCTLYCTFLPPLRGLDDGKMSSSVGQDATLFLTDDPKTIAKKIKKFAKSGSRGDGSKEDHEKLGGDVAEDIACNYLRYFEMNDEILNKDLELFSQGKILCSEMKEKLIVKLQEKFEEVQTNKKNLKQEFVDEFFKIKPIELPKQKEKEKTENQKKVEEVLNANQISFVTTYHNPIVLDVDYQELISRLQGSVCKCYLIYSQEKYILCILDVNTIWAENKLKKLAKDNGLKKLSMATKDTIKELIKCEENSVSPLGLIFDLENSPRKITEVWIDVNLSKEEKVNFSPLREDARITINYSDMVNFIKNIAKAEIKEVKFE